MEELSRQKAGKNKHADDVRETLQWLDEATTKHPDVVTLQGADETFERWAEVERFAVPRTLFSEHDHELEADSDTADHLADKTATQLDLSQADHRASLSSGASDVTGSLSPSSLRSVRSSASPVSPPTSPAKAVALPSLAGFSSRPTSSSASVPQPLQPLFNYILWRIHQETDPVAALESFIFLCNDPRKVSFAKGFDIKTKRLEQLREAAGREDRDHKNRQAMLNRENQTPVTGAEEITTQTEVDDEVVLKPQPPKAPAAMLRKQQSNVIDPNAFERGPQPVPQPHSPAIADLPNGTPKSPRAHNSNMHRGSPRGAHALPFAPRGSMRGVSRGRGRGALGTTRGGFAPKAAASNGPNGQIDPDSFARPDPRGTFNGPRGGRKLWVPT